MKPTPKIGKWMITLHLIAIILLTASLITAILEQATGAIILFIVLDILIVWSFVKGMKWV